MPERKFKPGDRVRLTSNDTELVVVRYDDKEPYEKERGITRLRQSDTYLFCSWMEKGRERIDMFHQDNLKLLP